MCLEEKTKHHALYGSYSRWLIIWTNIKVRSTHYEKQRLLQSQYYWLLPAGWRNHNHLSHRLSEQYHCYYREVFWRTSLQSIYEMAGRRHTHKIIGTTRFVSHECFTHEYSNHMAGIAVVKDAFLTSYYWSWQLLSVAKRANIIYPVELDWWLTWRNATFFECQINISVILISKVVSSVLFIFLDSDT